MGSHRAWISHIHWQWERRAILVTRDPGGVDLVVDDPVDGGEERVLILPSAILDDLVELVAGETALDLLSVEDAALQLGESLVRSVDPALRPLHGDAAIAAV